MTKGLLIIIALLLISLISNATADITCSGCGKIIYGTYYIAPDGSNYCEDCWKGSAICSICGKVTKSPVKESGLDFCRNCYGNIPNCSLCSRPLTGSFTEYPGLGIKICSSCEVEKPKCDRCGVPDNRLISSNGSNYCRRCLESADRCNSCRELITGEYSFFEGNKELKYCFNCTQKYSRCDNCGAPSGPNGTKLDDSRYLCPDCRKYSIFDTALVDPIKEKMLKYVTSDMRMGIRHDIDFSLRGKDYLLDKAKGIEGDLNGLFYRKGENFHIYVLYGLRQKDYISVLAHEISHAWQAENSPDDLPLIDLEGFAQWVAYKALVNFGHADFAELLKEGDSIYSRGLNKMLKIEKDKGSQAVFNHVIKSRARSNRD